MARRVWTAGESDDCQRFTRASDNDSASFGFSKETDADWTDAMLMDCDKPLRLYGSSGEFEQPARD